MSPLNTTVTRLPRRGMAWVRSLRQCGRAAHEFGAKTVGDILERHGIAPAHERARTTTRTEFIRTQTSVPVATDFFTAR